MERSPSSSLVYASEWFRLASNFGVPPLKETVLHLWTWNLDVEQKRLAQHEDVLCTEEWRRVRRLSSHRLARRFIVRRGMLRCILGQYLCKPPQDISFDYNPHGKPFLAPELSSDLHFNLSDSGELAALGVSLGQPIGIDIERLRPVPIVGGIESPGMSPRLVNLFSRLTEPERSHELLRAWACREAIVKAEGVGLQLLSEQFDFDGLADYLTPVSKAASAIRKRGFHIRQLDLPTGFVGYLATRQKTPEIFYCSPG